MSQCQMKAKINERIWGREVNSDHQPNEAHSKGGKQ